MSSAPHSREDIEHLERDLEREVCARRRLELAGKFIERFCATLKAEDLTRIAVPIASAPPEGLAALAAHQWRRWRDLREREPADVDAIEPAREALGLLWKATEISSETAQGFRVDPQGRLRGQRSDEEPEDLERWIEEQSSGEAREVVFPVVFKKTGYALQARVWRLEAGKNEGHEKSAPKPHVLLAPWSVEFLDANCLRDLETAAEDVLRIYGNFLLELEALPPLPPLLEVAGRSLLLPLLLDLWAAVEQVWLRPFAATGDVVGPNGRIQRTGDRDDIDAKRCGLERAMAASPELHLDAFHVPPANDIDFAAAGDAASRLKLRALPDTFAELVNDRWRYFNDGMDALREAYQRSAAAPTADSVFTDYLRKSVDKACCEDGVPGAGKLWRPPYGVIACEPREDPGTAAAFVAAEVFRIAGTRPSPGGHAPVPMPVLFWLGKLSERDGDARASAREERFARVKRGLHEIGFAAEGADGQRRRLLAALRERLERAPGSLVLVPFGGPAKSVTETFVAWIEDLAASGSRPAGVIFVASDEEEENAIRKLWKA